MSQDQQLKAWALDRAIETSKINGGNVTAASIITLADQYIAYVVPNAPEPVVEDKGFDDDAASLAMQPASNAVAA